MRLVGVMLLCTLAGGAAAAGGFLFHRWIDEVEQPSPVVKVAEPIDVARRPDFELRDTEGRLRRVAEWDGKLLVVNFWATWCPPCVHEIPVFNMLQRRYAGRGVQFLGIAIDDLDNVKTFIAEVGLDYPTLHGQLDAMDVGRAYGNRLGGLPFTVLVGPDGNVVHRHAGPLDEATAESLITELLDAS